MTINLSNNVLEALKKNNKIAAIKLLRIERGIDLKEAYAVIESYGQEQSISVSISEPQSLPEEVMQALESGNKIAAIKLLRGMRGIGLAQAKDIIDEYQDQHDLR